MLNCDDPLASEDKNKDEGKVKSKFDKDKLKGEDHKSLGKNPGKGEAQARPDIKTSTGGCEQHSEVPLDPNPWHWTVRDLGSR